MACHLHEIMHILTFSSTPTCTPAPMVECERDAAKFKEDARLLCETHEREVGDRTITTPDADMSDGNRK
eukprot:7989980-Karenia_brevis.AAC.1